MPGKRKLKASSINESDDDMTEESSSSCLLTTLEHLFGTRCLYEVLGVDKKANSSSIKRGYHKQSLKCHPDRIRNEEDKPAATKKFQALGAVYSVLSDDEKRKIYDETGAVDDSISESVKDWDQYWRVLFKKVTVKDIQKFEKEYKESEEELKDLKTAYLEGEGSMDYIMDHVLCAVQEDDEARFSEIIKKWIDSKQVPDFDAFSKESKRSKNTRKRNAAQEKEEAEHAARELGLGSGKDDLANLIMKRHAQRQKESESFLDNLAAKYSKPSSKKKSKKK